jgi:sugar/nucleoside kinase (ribokinase family)
MIPLTRKTRLLQMTGVVVAVLQKVERLPASGGGLTALASRIGAGGGFNALAAARGAGAEVAYGGALGTGPFADICLSALEGEGALMLQRRRMTGDQGFCTLWVEGDGERSYVCTPGAEREATAADLAALPVADFGWALLGGYAAPAGEDPFGDWLAALPHSVTLMFDPTPLAVIVGRAGVARALARADWVSANRVEAQALTGEEPARAAEVLAQGRRGAVVRDRARGCWVACGGAAVAVAGFPVVALDSAGAGDAHVGAFVAALMAEAAPVEAARFANAAAAIAVTRLGAATASSRGETERFLRARNQV